MVKFRLKMASSRHSHCESHRLENPVFIEPRTFVASLDWGLNWFQNDDLFRYNLSKNGTNGIRNGISCLKMDTIGQLYNIRPYFKIIMIALDDRWIEIVSKLSFNNS